MLILKFLKFLARLLGFAGTGDASASEREDTAQNNYLNEIYITQQHEKADQSHDRDDCL